MAQLASTVMEDSVLRKFGERAAARLRPGSRVVTLAAPLSNPAFRVERVVACVNSWGDEDAYVNILEPSAASPQVQLS